VATDISKALRASLTALAEKLQKERIQSELDMGAAKEILIRPRLSTDKTFRTNALETVKALTEGAATKDVLGGIEPPKAMKVVQSVAVGPKHMKIAAVAIKAPRAFASRLKEARPEIHVSPVTWLFPQTIDPLGAELESRQIPTDALTKGKKLSVRVLNDQGKPVVGVKVRAVLDVAQGHNVADETDVLGAVILRIPTGYDRVEVIFADPLHTYWSAFLVGFDREDIPAVPVDITVKPLMPDGYALVAGYAPADVNAGAGVRVGVIDTGVGPHQDLVVTGGLNVVDGEPDTDHKDNGLGHGTHVAGIIAARNLAPGGGLLGIAPKVELMSYRVCARKGESYDKAKSVDVARALEKAIQDKCDLVNISLGNHLEMPEVAPLLALARDKGIVVIASMGNDGKEMARYPAWYDDAVGVAALGRHGTFPDNSRQAFLDVHVEDGDQFVPGFSNYGERTDFSGVGYAVVSTFPNDRYAVQNGTSMAAPYITGMTARLLSANRAALEMARGPARTAAILTLAAKAAKLVASFPQQYQGKGVVK